MYNVMHAMGDDITFRKIITDIIKETGEIKYVYLGIGDGYPTNFEGEMGTNPLYIGKYMQRCGYKVRCRHITEVFSENYAINTHDAYIALYFYEWGGHYEALIPNSNNKLDAYNINRSYLDFEDYVSWKSYSENAFLFYIYEIDR